MDGIRRSVAIGIVASAALFAAGWITVARIQTLDAAAGWVQRTQNTRLVLERTLSSLKDAETTSRGYAVTRDEIFLPPYRASLVRIEADLEELKERVAHNPTQLAHTRELERLIRTRLEPMDRGFELVQRGIAEVPRERLARAQLEGNALMATVRAQAAVMHREEERLLNEQLEAVSGARDTAMLVSGGTTALAAALVLLILVLENRSTRRLRASEEWLATTLRSIGDAVIATDERGCVKYLNPVASQLTGWSAEEARTRTLDEILPLLSEDSGHAVENPVARVLREGKIVGLANHTLLVRRDGTSVAIEDSGAPILDERGTTHGVVMVFRDASAERAAAQKLAANEERLRLATEGAELGTWDIDLATDRLVLNEQYERILGFGPGAEVTRERVRERIMPEDRDLVMQAIERARGNKEPFHIEYRIVRANDSSERWVSVLGRYLFDEEGKPSRIIGIVTDITERRRLEQRVRQAQKLDALGTLAGGIAHDFNNILSIMRGNLLLIEADLPPGDPIAPAISEMSRACSRARDLVRQILTFGRQQEQDRKIVSLTEVIEEAVKLLRSTVPASIEIRSRFAPDMPPVLADPTQIHQVVMNLGINASHAIGRGAGVILCELDEVHVDADVAQQSPDLHEGRYVRLRFGDSGSGMSREVLERIFEPFFTTKPQGGGTGLGLSVVRGIVKSHDGAITVYSKPGKGTQFHLYFPAVEGVAAEPAKPAPQPVRGTGQRILYLDDEAPLVLLARRLLERLGYEVAGYSDAAEALAAFEAAPDRFDLVLSDLSMPGLSGIEVARRVIEIRPDIPVLLASGYVRTEDVELAREIGVREVIWKPATINEMGELLARTLEKVIPRS